MPANVKSVPRHIAIIMDGNGRWAKARGLPRIKGHEAGAQAVRQCVEGCGELKVEYLTLYAFSAENWQRPKTEVLALMRLLEKFLKEKTPELVEKNVRLQAIGRLTDLPASSQEQLHKTIAELWRPSRNHRRYQKFASRHRARSHRQGDDRCGDVQQTPLHTVLSRSRSSYPHFRRNASVQLPSLANILYGDVHHT